MDTYIIACESILNEVEQVKEEVNCKAPVLWLPMGLHNIPEKLNSCIKEKIKEARDCRRILFAMGFCGYAMEGICSEMAEMVIPRVDDCISLLLGSTEKKKQLNSQMGTYFLTDGWMQGEKNLWKEYEHLLKRYGEERGKSVMNTMLAHYERIGVLDTGAYNLEDILPQSLEMAREWNLVHEVFPTQQELLRKLLLGRWNEKDFLIVKPGHVLEKREMR